MGLAYSHQKKLKIHKLMILKSNQKFIFLSSLHYYLGAIIIRLVLRQSDYKILDK